MKVKLLKSTSKTAQLEIPNQLLESTADSYLIAQLYRAESINQRQPRKTKTRAERSGGGAKPWRQKGTGRARHGSSRSPIWRKGGVVFGPQKESNPHKRANKKSKKQVVRSLLSDFYKDQRLILVDQLPKSKKTKKWEGYLATLPIKDAGRLLLVLGKKEGKNRIYCQNIPYLTVVNNAGINVSSLLDHDQLIVTKEAMLELVERLAGK